VIDVSRNIGVGTSAPGQKLHVIGNALVSSSLYTSNIVGNAYSLSNINASYISTGTLANARLPTAFNVNTSSQTITVQADGNVGVGTNVALRNLHVQGDLNFTGGLYKNNAPFASSQWGDGIDSSLYYTTGNVGVGTTNPQYLFHAEGDSYISHVYTTEVTMTSDSNLKRNVRTIENAMDLVSQLRGVEFEWKSTNPRSSIGLIAQEVEQVLPNVVHEDHSGHKSISYANMVGLLIEALKEQQEKIRKLEEKLGM
jgi:hypothetical protein